MLGLTLCLYMVMLASLTCGGGGGVGGVGAGGVGGVVVVGGGGVGAGVGVLPGASAPYLGKSIRF